MSRDFVISLRLREKKEGDFIVKYKEKLNKEDKDGVEF